MRPLELLAPAKDAATARDAIIHGADAVYIGAHSFGARSRAVNSLDDLRQVVEFAHPYGVKVYATVNTIIYDHELKAAEKMIRELYDIGIDALIVQDLAILKMDIPPIPLHASTQCDTRTPEKARMLRDCGFEQIVVARELSLEQLRDICQSVDVPVEAFVHGALCVCYSGDCQASFVNNGRSANRGECAQMCRLPYDLLDAKGNTIGRQKHYLSLKDMNRIDSLSEMAEAGVSSFKIEGRLKDSVYVKNVVAAYRRALDKVIESNPDQYYRPSRGLTATTFTPSLDKSFNRGFSSYFLTPSAPTRIATFDSPKALGQLVGRVVAAKGKVVEAKLSCQLANGDGLSFITPQGATGGFRVNRAERSKLILQSEISLPAGTSLYRSFDKSWEDSMKGTTATRVIPVDIELKALTDSGVVALSAQIDGLKGAITVSAAFKAEPSLRPDNGYRRSQMAKLGNTIFSLRDFVDEAEGLSIPASVLSDLRRQLVEAMMAALLASSPSNSSMHGKKPACKVDLKGVAIDRHANVANHLARQFYEEAGAGSIEPAIEVSGKSGKGLRVMTTRYCLRRELGKCLKANPADKPELYLRGANFTYRLDFDCPNCRMTVTTC